MSWRHGNTDTGRLPFVYRVKSGRPFAGRLLVATTVSEASVVGNIRGAIGPKQFGHDDLTELSPLEIEKAAGSSCRGRGCSRRDARRMTK